VPFFKALSFSGVLILLMEGQIRRRIVIQVLVVTVVWATAPWLIERGGIAGAVSAQLLSEGVLGVGYLLIAVRSLRLTEPPVWPPRRIVITHLHGSGNVGDAAIHQTQYAIIKTLFPAAHITVAAALPATLREAFPNATVIRSIHSWVYADDGTIAPRGTRVRRAVALLCAVLLGRWGIGARWGLDATERASLAAFRNADVVYASGGGYLYDEPVAHPWRRLLGWDLWLIADLLIARALQRPLVLLPQSIGPCTNGPFRIVLCWLLGQANRIYARDSATSMLLRQWGIAHRNAPDIAWYTENPPVAHETSPQQPVLGVSALNWGAQYPSFRGQTAYEDALVGTIEHYAARGWRIQLYSQCREANPAWDDLLVTQRIAQRATCTVEIMPDIPDPSALALAYAGLDCLIATRMHAAILRMRSGGSCVVIGYLPKAAALMADLGLAAWHVPITHVDATTLCALVDRRADQVSILKQARAHIHSQQQVFVDDLRMNPVIGGS
jgi:polysaccharide pyruvyl transferase WcaK-like protein